MFQKCVKPLPLLIEMMLYFGPSPSHKNDALFCPFKQQVR